jgi:biotin carboxyl carrier protein
MTDVRADIAANVWQVHAEPGHLVTIGQELLILESMKMEIPVEAPVDGVVTAVNVAPGDAVTRGQVLIEIS